MEVSGSLVSSVDTKHNFTGPLFGFSLAARSSQNTGFPGLSVSHDNERSREGKLPKTHPRLGPMGGCLCDSFTCSFECDNLP